MKTLFITFLLFISPFVFSQTVDINKEILGFIVIPKNYQPFESLNGGNNLNKILKDKETLWFKKSKAYGVYAFNLVDKQIGFFIGEELITAGKIISLDQNKHSISITSLNYGKDNVQVLVNYFISISKKNDFDFAIWWYDQNEGITRGEISEKINIEFVKKD